MASYETTLKSRKDVARDTTAFFFNKPEGFSFEAGQTLSLTLPNPGDAEHPTQKHTFSIISAPFEDHVGIATRMRDSAFKRELGTLQPGSAVTFSGPYGKLTLPPEAAHPIVLIAGGIGITPYLSMLRQAAHGKLPH
ncbi:MAG: FAD-dependent oxidoreductase, partial [Alcaligenaceae bacterium]|nr:FAD-dependent oxidoreductase [Alcaligenaceae bacterium]